MNKDDGKIKDIICQVCGKKVPLGKLTVDDFYYPLGLFCDHCGLPVVISGIKIRNMLSFKWWPIHFEDPYS